MSWINPATLAAAVAAVACIVTILATGLLLRQLQARSILDHPNERSSHDRAVPRGGGIAVMGVVAGGWCLWAWWQGHSLPLLAVAALAVILAAVSFMDDLRGLPALPRLAIQAVAVALGCLALPDGAIFQGLLPDVADRLLAGFFWLWFVNLYNFMDGIDGITVVETGAIAIGLVLLTAVAGVAAPLPTPAPLAMPAAIIAGAAIGFAVWNWHPAKIFLGDVGSVGLGFLLGWLLLSLAASGQWLPALLLPLYYLTDATWTLLRRLIRGEKVWQAHRTHFYQYAVRHGSGQGDAQGGGHAHVALMILGCNLVLIAAAIWAAKSQTLWSPLALGCAAVAVLLYKFTTMRTVAKTVAKADAHTGAKSQDEAN